MIDFILGPSSEPQALMLTICGVLTFITLSSLVLLTFSVWLAGRRRR